MSRSRRHTVRRSSSLRARFDAWQEEPWDLPSWRELDSWYRRTAALGITALLAVSGLTVLLLRPDWGVQAWWSPAIVACIATGLSLLHFQISEQYGASPVLVSLVATMMAGMPTEALICAVAFSVINPIRKPLPINHAIYNLAYLGTAAVVGASVMQATGMTSHVFSIGWLASAVLAGSVYFFANTPLYVSNAEPGNRSWRDWLNHWTAGLRVEVAELFPLAILLGASLTHRGAVPLLAMLIPAMITGRTFAVMHDHMHAENRANLDALTGIPNRRRMDVELESAVALSRPGHGSVWVVMLDLDNFKRLNDKLGHQIGDLALQRAARALQHSIRADDFCGRYGGEEFVAIVRDVAHDEMLQIAERIRANIEGVLAEFDSSASIGVALHEEDAPYKVVLDRADQALYQAKVDGKNRVVTFDPAEHAAA